MIKFNNSRATMIWQFRYALGRQTYAVGMVVDDILGNWDELSVHDKLLIKMEIKEAIQFGTAGGKMDIAQWEQVLEGEL